MLCQTAARERAMGRCTPQLDGPLLALNALRVSPSVHFIDLERLDEMTNRFAPLVRPLQQRGQVGSPSVGADD